MKTALALLFIQGCIGAVDTLYYHEFKLRLPDSPTARKELKLHASRDAIYTLIFGSFAWLICNGLWAAVLIFFLLLEIIITLRDFVEEDASRNVPAGERIMHAVMGIIYGAFLANILPQVFIWLQQPTGLIVNRYGRISWLLTVMAAGVLGSGLRDLLAVRSTISIEHQVKTSRV
jgi:hypothetical protein